MSAYRCPVCHIESRLNDNTKKEGDNNVRTVKYNCGTILKVISNGFRYKTTIIKAEKCIETSLIVA